MLKYMSDVYINNNNSNQYKIEMHLANYHLCFLSVVSKERHRCGAFDAATL